MCLDIINKDYCYIKALRYREKYKKYMVLVNIVVCICWFEKHFQVNKSFSFFDHHHHHQSINNRTRVLIKNNPQTKLIIIRYIGQDCSFNIKIWVRRVMSNSPKH